MDKKAFGKRLNLIKDINNLTPQQLADMTDVTMMHIYQMQNGNRLPSMTFFVKLCNLFKTCPSYFLQDSLEFDTDIRFNELNNYLKLLSPDQYNMVKTMVKTLINEK